MRTTILIAVLLLGMNLSAQVLGFNGVKVKSLESSVDGEMSYCKSAGTVTLRYIHSDDYISDIDNRRYVILEKELIDLYSVIESIMNEYDYEVVTIEGVDDISYDLILDAIDNGIPVYIFLKVGGHSVSLLVDNIDGLVNIK